MDEEFKRRLLALHLGDGSYFVRIAVAPQDIVRALNSTTARVLLSAETVQKAQAKHREVQLEDYERIQYVLSQGFVYKDKSISVVVCRWFAELGIGYRASVKVTRDKSQLFLQSFHRLHRPDHERLRRRADDRYILIRHEQR